MVILDGGEVKDAISGGDVIILVVGIMVVVVIVFVGVVVVKLVSDGCSGSSSSWC